MTLSDHQAAFTQDISRLIRLARMMEPRSRVRLSYVERSIPEQQRLIDIGASGLEDPASSQHTKRLAADLLLDLMTETGWEWQTETKAYRDLGAQWELMSIFNRWGGRYHDGNHFERLMEPRREANSVYA